MTTVTLTDIAQVKAAAREASRIVLVGDFTLAAKAKALAGLENAGALTLDLRKAKIRAADAGGELWLSDNRDLTVLGGEWWGRVRVNTPRGVTLEGAQYLGGMVGEGGRGLVLRNFRSRGMLSFGVSGRDAPLPDLVVEDGAVFNPGNDGVKLGAPQDVTLRRLWIVGQQPEPGQHLDGVQCLFGSGPCHNITMEGLRIASYGMGITLATKGGLTWHGVRIRRCRVDVGSTDAIAIGPADDIELTDIEINALPQTGVSPRLRQNGAWTNLVRGGNRINGALIDGPSPYAAPAADVGDDAAVAVLRAQLAKAEADARGALVLAEDRLTRLLDAERRLDGVKAALAT